MSYHISKLVNLPFELAEQKAKDELKKIGLGLVSEIDVKNTFKEKLDKDFKNYKIYGFCNPAMAYEALQIERNLGVLLPCTVVIQQFDDSNVEISFVDPVPYMNNVENEKIKAFSYEIEKLLKQAFDNIY